MVLTASLPQKTTSTTVLLIDDDESHRTYWSDVLRNRSSNYSVLEAADNKSGLDICRDHAVVDCVLLDLDMPESGFQVLLELIPHPKHPQIAVVILTHLVHPVLSEMAKDLGAQAWLVKQHTSAEELDTAIQQAVISIQSRQ